MFTTTPRMTDATTGGAEARARIMERVRKLLAMTTESGAADTDAAHRMQAMFCMTMESEFHSYMRSPARDRRRHATKERTDFMIGMVRRIDLRIAEICEAREASIRAAKAEQAPAVSGRAMVVATKAMVLAEKFAEYAAREGLQLTPRAARVTVRSSKAAAAGYAAGSRVDMGGSSISGGVKMIGR
jgi:hypothetical protein